MSLRDYIQDRPAPLVWSWLGTERVLNAMRPLFEKMGLERASSLVRIPEEIVKHPLFGCHDCGQCVLHYTGLTCPMNCPKQLRNGPCGGVRLNGKCEVKPEMDCVWVKAYERSAKTPWAFELLRLNPPVDWRLEGMASWVTMPMGRDQVPTGTDVKVRYANEVLPAPAAKGDKP